MNTELSKLEKQKLIIQMALNTEAGREALNAPLVLKPPFEKTK